MTNRTWLLLLVGVLLGLAAWWFTQNFGFVTERVHVGYRGEAAINRFYAARLLLEKLGMRVHQKADLAHLGTLPPRAVMILAANRNDVDPVTARELLAWVDRGGHLIIGAEYELPHDVLLDLLGVSIDYSDEDRAAGATVDTVSLPDGTPLRVELMPSTRLVDDDEQSEWRHEFRGGVRMLQLRRGEGRITLMSSLRMFGNARLGHFDHAELLARLTADSGGEIWLIRYLEAPSLPRWLWEHAAPVLAALAVFVLLALWRAMLRFGPLRPSPAPDRKSLLAHVHAMGRFYADQGQLAPLLRRLRADCDGLLDRAAPQMRGMDGSRRLKEAARLTRLRPRHLLSAFTETVSYPKDFTHAVRTLAQFRSRLARRVHQEESK